MTGDVLTAALWCPIAGPRSSEGPQDTHTISPGTVGANKTRISSPTMRESDWMADFWEFCELKKHIVHWVVSFFPRFGKDIFI